MLDSFLNVAYVHEAREQQEKEAVALLKQLPISDLLKLAQGEKVAWMDQGCGPNQSPSFLEKFRGTPLFAEALALEEEELQADMTDLERRKEQRVQEQASTGLWDLRDQLRIKRRLLELRLAQQDAAATAAPPLAAPPAPPALEGGAQGAGAMGPEAAPVEANKTAGTADHIRKTFDAVKGKAGDAAKKGLHHLSEQATLHPRSTMAAGMGTVGAGLGAVEGALRGKEWKEKAKEHPKSTMWQHAAKHPVRHGALTGGAANALGGAILGHMSTKGREEFRPGSVERARAFVRRNQALEHARKSVEQASKHAEFKPSEMADRWGRELARADFAKAAEVTTLARAAKEAGHVLAKEAAGLGGLASMASNFARNPKNLGTVVGAGAGALSGLAGGLRKDEHGQRHLLSGLAQGAAGGAAGALAGHAVQNIGGAVRGGTPLAAAAKQYGAGMAGRIRGVANSLQPQMPLMTAA